MRWQQSLMRLGSVFALSVLIAGCGSGSDSSSSETINLEFQYDVPDQKLEFDKKRANLTGKQIIYMGVNAYQMVDLMSYGFNNSYMIPDFSKSNTNSGSIDCKRSGRLIQSVDTNQMSISTRFIQCDDGNETFDGHLEIRITSRNEEAGTFSVRSTYDQVSAKDSYTGISETTNGYIEADIKLVANSHLVNADVQVHMEIDSDLRGGSEIHELEFSIEGFEVEGTYGTDWHYMASGFHGTVGVADQGYISVDWNAETGLTKFSGQGDLYSELRWTKDIMSYEFTDETGQQWFAVEDSNLAYIDASDIIDYNDDLPESGYSYLLDQMEIANAEASTPLNGVAYDRDFDLLSYNISVIYDDTDESTLNSLIEGQLRIALIESGNYRINYQVEDMAGNQATGTHYASIYPDTDGDGNIDLYDNDDDNDGYNDDDDAFPLDNTEWLDSDQDGIGNNRDEDDDNDGVSDTNDPFPLSAICDSNAPLINDICLYTLFDANLISDIYNDTLYLISPNEKILMTMDAISGELVDYTEIGTNNAVGYSVRDMFIYESLGRLYILFSNGTVNWIDLTSNGLTETYWAGSDSNLLTLWPAGEGKFIRMLKVSNYDEDFDLVDSEGQTLYDGYNYYLSKTESFIWSAVRQKGFLISSTYPKDIEGFYIQENSILGFDSPYHGDFDIEPPLMLIDEEMNLLLPSGLVLSTDDLTIQEQLAGNIAAAADAPNNEALIVRSSESHTVLERLGTERNVLETQQYTGLPLAIHSTSTGAILITLDGNGHFQIHRYVPNNDLDEDGVSNVNDAFPEDAAASMDSDSDGYPDQWNTDVDPDDPMTDLVLDAFPYEFSCFLESHNVDGVCDPDRLKPQSQTELTVMDDDGNLYLVDRASGQIFRWSTSREAPLPSWYLKLTDGDFVIDAEIHLAHQRLYLLTHTGKLFYFTMTDAFPGAELLVTFIGQGESLVKVDDYLIAHTEFDYRITTVLLDESGNILFEQELWRHAHQHVIWNSALKL